MFRKLALTTLVFGCATFMASAANILKADNANSLNLGASWVNSVAPGTSDIATWDQTVVINTNTDPLGANLSWSGIQILNPAGAITIPSDGNTLTLEGSGIDLSMATNGLTLDNPVVLGADQTWNVTNGQTLTVVGVVSGSGLLTLNNGGNNTGTIILNAANTYTGNTVINSGIVQPANATSFGPSTAFITNNGGTLFFGTFPNSGIINNQVVQNGTTLYDMDNRSISVVLDAAFSGSGTIIVTNDTASGSTLTFGGNGVGGGSMNSFTGSVIVLGTNAAGTASAGTLRFNNGGGVDNTGNASASFNLGDAPSAIVFVNRDAATMNIGELTGGPGTSLSGQTSGSGTITWSIGGKNTSTTFYGTIVNKSSTAICALTKVGTGTFTLYGNNTYTGATTISAGVLQIGDGATSGQGTLGTGAVANAASLVFNKPDSYTVANNISGAGAVAIQAGGTLTYTGADSSSGTMIVSDGDLILGSSGTIIGLITVDAGATFDVSQNPTFTLSQTLSGSGLVNGALVAVSGNIIPGGKGVAGTLTFATGLTETGGVNNQFYLSSPSGANDLIAVSNLTVSGVNYISALPFGSGTLPDGTYPLFTYSGTFTGSLTNFSVTVIGVNGVLSNPPGQIELIISPATRGPTNLTWTGDGVSNSWDTASANDWVNGSTRFTFQAGDSVLFGASGASNPVVTLNAEVLPGAVVVNSSSNYTFAGDYEIAGATGLTKTNSGVLTITTTNSYTGPTIVGGGVLEAQNLTIGGASSAIGAAASDPTNLVFYGSVLAYSGPSTNTDRSATLNGSGLTVNVENSGVTLELDGSLTGPGGLTVDGPGILALAGPSTYLGGTVINNSALAAITVVADASGFGTTNSPITFANNGSLTLLNSTGDDGSTTYNFYNPLVVPAGQNGTLAVFERGQVWGALTGGGVLNVTAGGQRAAFAGDWSAFTGTINLTGNFRINNTFGYSNAVFFLNGSSDLDGGTDAGVGGTGLTFDIGELDATNNSPTLGAITKASPSPTWRVGWKNTTSFFAGTIEDPTATAGGGYTSITKVGTGQWVLAGQNTYTGATTISAGTLALTNAGFGDAVIENSTNIVIDFGAALDVSGRSDDTFSLNSGQTLSGTGTLRGMLNTDNGGTVAPGSPVGTLTVTNTVTLGGTTLIYLNREASPNSGRLSSPAGITLGGTLVVSNIGAILQPNDTFTLFSGPFPLPGSFGSLVLPGLYTWNTSNLAVNGTISVTATTLPPMALSSFQIASGAITFSATGGPANVTVSLVSATNLAPPVSWTLIQTTNFDGNGNFSGLSVPLDPSAPQEFYSLEIAPY